MNEKPRMKIFIDLSNIEQGIRDYRDYGISVDYRELVNIVSEGYEVVGMHVYDGKPVGGKLETITLHQILRGQGFEVTELECAAYVGEYSTHYRQKEVDTSMTVDIVETACGSICDCVVIMSGDRDFRPSVISAKSHGMLAIVVSTKGSLSEELRKESDAVVLIDDLPVFSFRETDSSRGIESNIVAEAFADVS